MHPLPCYYYVPYVRALSARNVHDRTSRLYLPWTVWLTSSRPPHIPAPRQPTTLPARPHPTPSTLVSGGLAFPVATTAGTRAQAGQVQGKGVFQYGGVLPFARHWAWLLQNERSYSMFAPGGHHKRQRHAGYFLFYLDYDGDLADVPMHTDLAFANPDAVRGFVCAQTQFAAALPAPPARPAARPVWSHLCTPNPADDPSVRLNKLENRISIVRPRELEWESEDRLMLWLYVGEPLWAHTMKHHLEETSARIDAILDSLPVAQANQIRTASATLATYSPIPSFNMETMLYVDAANAFKKVDARFGPGASEITNGFAFVIGWNDDSFGLLSDKKAVSLFWNFPGTDAYASVVRNLDSAGGRRVFRQDATAAIVAYRPLPPPPGGPFEPGEGDVVDDAAAAAANDDGAGPAVVAAGPVAPKEFWTTSITGNLDSKAMENLMGGAPCRGPGGVGHGAQDLPARIWAPSDGTCATAARDDSKIYVPTGQPMCYWNWRLDMCGKSRLLEMTLFLRDVCKVAITRVIGIEVFSIEWPACYVLLRETVKRDTRHNAHTAWKTQTERACANVIKMAHPNKWFDAHTRAFGRTWAASNHGGFAMLQCPNAKIEEGGCKELKRTLHLAFYKVPPARGGGAAGNAGAADPGGAAGAAVAGAADAANDGAGLANGGANGGANGAANGAANAAGQNAAAAAGDGTAAAGNGGHGVHGAAGNAGAAGNGGPAAAAAAAAVAACNAAAGDDDDDLGDNPPHNLTPNADAALDDNLSRTGFVYLRPDHGYHLVLPSPENALEIQKHFKAYIAHNPVLQVAVAERRAEALYTCTRAEQAYKAKVSALQHEVNNAPESTKEEKTAKRKLQRNLKDAKRNGRGVGLEEMVALYDLEKDSEHCRYVMDNGQVLAALVAGARKITQHAVSTDAAAMDITDALFKTERTTLRALVPNTRGNFLKKATCGIGTELFHNLRNPVLFADLLYGDETFSEKMRAFVDGSMHACFRCPGSSFLGRAMVMEARMYDKKCKVTDGTTRYSKLKAKVKSVCGLETGISLGGHPESWHIKRLSSHGFDKCMSELDFGGHYQPGSKCSRQLHSCAHVLCTGFPSPPHPCPHRTHNYHSFHSCI